MIRQEFLWYLNRCRCYNNTYRKDEEVNSAGRITNGIGHTCSSRRLRSLFIDFNVGFMNYAGHFQ